ncbi:MAG TPA: Holliday junction resolvase RuvX [Deltaproteobacteria bacterium]|nr:Holliday junction resolvase RuvX [Deltaproteobacteria bacterium]HCP46203.1 Holliday junction resolvase RuvX [Deltaproteobacteria bacterium]
MRTLALDVGTKTIGVAISDPLGMFAQPVETIRRVGRKKDVERLASHVREREVGCVVVGLPLKTDGSEGPSADEARRMVTALEEALDGVNVLLQDERFTTQQAERALIGGGVRRKKRKGVIDQVAAVLILQAYLDSRG